MTPRRRKAPPIDFKPLTMTWQEAATIAFRADERWLRAHIGDFPDFPQPDGALGLFAVEAVETWVRRRFGLLAPLASRDDDSRARIAERMRARDQGALPR